MDARNSRLSTRNEGNEMVDTASLARQEREIQRHHEYDCLNEGEADLHQHYNDCTKNKGHLKFRNVNDFSVEHLPPHCQDIDIVHLVQTLSDITVCVSSTHVSERRPQTVTQNNIEYPFYNMKGRSVKRWGTGRVWAVDLHPNGNAKQKTCTCSECKNSPTPETRFAEIRIQTAAHLVYDDLEGADIVCHLFYDNGDTPDDCSGVVTLKGMSGVWSNVQDDWCRMVHTTHDMGLAERLNKMVQEWDRRVKEVKDKYMSRLPTHTIADYWHKLTIIVSHPHGCSKKVSVGHYTKRNEKEGGVSQYTYTTCTCNGSSGAHVLVMARSPRVWFDNLVHSGHVGESFSSYGSDSVLV